MPAVVASYVAWRLKRYFEKHFRKIAAGANTLRPSCALVDGVLFEGVWCSNYRHRCPCALGGVASRGFGAGTCRHSCCSNATFLEVYSVSPHPARVLSVLGSKSCSRCGLAYMCSPDHGFYRLDRPLALSGPKVCTIIALFACTFRKRL